MELIIGLLLSVLRISSFLKAFALVCRINFVPMDPGWEGSAIRELSKGGLSEKHPYLS